MVEKAVFSVIYSMVISAWKRSASVASPANWVWPKVRVVSITINVISRTIVLAPHAYVRGSCSIPYAIAKIRSSWSPTLVQKNAFGEIGNRFRVWEGGIWA